MEKTIEIPFGAKDSELRGWEYTIPENMEAEIKDGKIIVKQKESEDERIRKQLIGFLSGRYALCNINTKDAIAYLERQKEQKPESCDCSRDEESYTNGIHHVLMNPEAYGLIKQKPAEQLGGTFTSYDMAKTFTEGQNYVIAHPEKFGLCKPAEWSEDWREEDIQTRFAFYTYKDDASVLYLSNVFVEEASRNHGFGTRILRAAEKVAEAIGATTISLKVKQDSPANAWYRKNGYGYVTFEDGYDWLEKNLEYMKPYKQEWSEEDDALLKEIVSFFKDGTTKLQHDLDLYAGFLEKKFKSLHPQPHWKPSEEQMEALEHFIRSWGESGTMGPQNTILCAANSLLTDLQKLL